MKYRITASLTGNTNDKFEAEIEADSEDEAWAIAYRSQLPRGIYNGKVEELPTRAELISENEQLWEALKQAKELVYYHHEMGHIRHAAENIFDNCDVCEKDGRLKKLLDAARALAQRS